MEKFEIVIHPLIRLCEEGIQKGVFVDLDAFGNPNCIRISYAASQEQLIEAIKRIKEAIS